MSCRSRTLHLNSPPLAERPQMSMLPQAAGTRMQWMDGVRGTAILLLLLWHSSAVPEMYGVQIPDYLRTINAFFLPYRMPTLMLLSGMLLTRSLDKPLPKYYAGKFAMILWPYLVWVLIAKGVFLNIEGMPWWHWRAWYATSYLWFLFFIGVYYFFAPLFKHLPSWIPIGLAGAIGVLLPYGSVEQRMGYYAIFFFAGSALSRYPEVLRKLTTRRLAFTFGFVAVLFGVAAALWTAQLQFLVWGAPLSIAGGLALMSLYSKLSQGGKFMRTMQFLGRSSLIFYVSHFPLMTLISRTPLADFSPVLVTLANLVAAVAIGTVLALLKHQVPIKWFFQAPDTLSKAIAALLGIGRRRQPA
ncbi:acyltransferase family protein [Microbacterium sp. KR10-403]|uniref:acyltransferase family protein n=1 Tax=Microbacterium sp. KR10-403 TaxID=3158581 RepID=UPI0032E3D1A6